MPSTNNPRLLSIPKAAAYLGMSRATLEIEINKGLIRVHRTPSVTINGTTYPAKYRQILIDDLDQYIESFLSIDTTAIVRSDLLRRKAN